MERVPWAEGKNHLTTTYAWFLAKWAKRLFWKEVADAFETKWDNVFRSVKMAVTWGLVKQAILTGSRWCLLKRPENCTENQTVKLRELLAINLKTVRAYLLKEDFQQFWGYKSVGWATKFLDNWCKRTMRSRIVPMKKIAKMLRSHRDLFSTGSEQKS